MGVIYKITNLINNKIYIGQTWKTEPQRWQEHVWRAFNDPSNDSIYLCNAIKKYGKENFKREIIDESNSVEELNNKEINYIKQYNTTDPNIGYNICIGGSGHTRYDSETILNLYMKYKCIAQVAKILSASKDTISQRLKNMGIITQNLTVLQYDIYGNFINSFENFSAANRQFPELQLPKLIPANRFASNYFWLREVDNENIEDIIKNYKLCTTIKKEIQQYDQLGKYIASYKSAAEASRVLKIDVSSIKAALNGRQVSAGGYLWYKPMGTIDFNAMYNNFLLSKSCCQIEEVDENGNILQTYKSAGELEKKMNWAYNCVKLVCDGKYTHTHGRIFRYSNPNKRALIQIMKEQDKS